MLEGYRTIVVLVLTVISQFVGMELDVEAATNAILLVAGTAIAISFKLKANQREKELKTDVAILQNQDR